MGKIKEKFSTRAKRLSGSSTMATTQLAKNKMKQGEKIILATVGEPDGDVPELAKIQLRENLNSLSKYGSAQGIPEVRSAIAEWMSSLYNQNWDLNNIIISPGSKFSLFSLFQIFCEAGDAVLVPTPAWVSYVHLAEMAGARVIKVPCDFKSNYKITAHNLEDYLKKYPQIKVLMLNSPNNPSGAVYNKSELKEIAQVIERYPDLWILSDDIYNQLIFSNTTRCPHLLDYLSVEAKERVVVIHGASKSFGLTGWRLGWTVATPDIIEKLAQFQSQTLTCVPDLLQTCLIPVLKSEGQYVVNLRNRIKNRYEMAFKKLSASKSLRVFPSEGAFYIWFEVFNPKMNSEKLALDLLNNKGVALMAGSAFGVENHFRLSVTIPDDQLNEAIEKILEFF